MATEVVAATTLYRELAQTLLGRIRDGQYAVGATMPREVDLSAEFGVSRSTVREALRLMEVEEAIIRRRRAGTIVAGLDATGPRRLNFDLPFSLDELTRETKLVIFAKARRQVPDGLVQETPNPVSPDWLYLAGLRRSLAGDAPMSITEVYLHPRLSAVARLIGQRRGLIYRLVEQECGERMRQVRTRVEPCRVTAREAARLVVPARSLATRMVQRIYNDAGELLEVAVGLYPAERFVFDMSFSLREGPKTRALQQ